MNEHRVHVYASGRAFVVVPVCHQVDGGWVECQPVREIVLEKGLPFSIVLGHAIDRAVTYLCADPQPWDGVQGRWWEHHLFVARLAWKAETLRLFILPEAEPAAEWPANTSNVHIARHLIAQLGQALA
ncbi:MAG: hypothetical protein JXA33_00025 [Anaerolineae bacterium]|nr:hypothetical protein [Anaerolineae bacterium]